MTSGTLAPPPVVADDILCAHCGLPADEADDSIDRRVDRHEDALVNGREHERHDGPIFCCDACATAYAVLREHGLGAYHRFPERRRAAVAPSGQAFSDFDHDAFAARYITRDANGLAHVELSLEGVHCASCVWLVERVPLLVSGIARTELDVRQSRASVTWDPSVTALSVIAQALDTLGYTPHPSRSGDRRAMRRQADRAMLVRIGVAGAIATNAMLLAMAIYAGEFATMDAATLQLFRWLSLLLTVPTLVWPGRIFFTSAIAALRARTAHIDIPIALALFAATTRGVVNTVSATGPIYFDGVCALVFLLLVGRYVQGRGQRAATDATEHLFALTPSSAHAIAADGTITDVPADSLAIGACIAIRAGETVPADGIVVVGLSRINTAILTGESVEIPVGSGDAVYAGTLNRAAALTVRVTATGDDRRLARILAQVDENARRRAPVVLLADRLASRLVVIIIAFAVATFVLWLRRGDTSAAWDNMIAVLVATCPCALALATPLAMSASVGRAARAGIYIKGADALESLSRPGWMVFDKTGTLTVGETTLVDWRGRDEVKPWVLALEAASTHAVADGFRRAWPSMAPTVATDIEHVIGGGVMGYVRGHRVVVGSPRLIVSQQPRVAWPAWASADGHTPVIVMVDGVIVARAAFGDAIRDDARIVLDTLRKRGWQTLLLSGDDRAVSTRVGRALGFMERDIVAEATPEEKASRVRELVDASNISRERRCVAMVGDGVNDAAALASATVGIGVRGAAEASLAAADVAITHDGLTALVALDEGATRTMRIIRRNIGYAVAYNTVGLALSMTGHVTPLVAAIIMPVSSLTVVLASWLSTTFTAKRV